MKDQFADFTITRYRVPIVSSCPSSDRGCAMPRLLQCLKASHCRLAPLELYAESVPLHCQGSGRAGARREHERLRRLRDHPNLLPAPQGTHFQSNIMQLLLLTADEVDSQ